MLTYLPLELNENNCVVLLDSNTYRVFDNIPTIGNTISYTDFFTSNHYVSSTGVLDITDTITCQSIDNFTTNVFYRFDISDIMITFSCIFFVSIFLIYFALKCFFRGFFK